jgi:hypothetical protein
MAAIDIKYSDLLKNIGKGAANALFPEEIPYYFLAFELFDSKGKTVDYFAFPVLPDEIQDSQPEITTIRKSIGAVSVLKNPTFNPRQINIRGDFGRKFRVLINGQKFDFAGIGAVIKSIKNKKFSFKGAQFSSFAKNGYGCVKAIESIKEKSKQLDEYQKPHTLVLYNPILGNNYVVEFNNFTHKQDNGRYNMISGYAIQLTAVAPLNNLLSSSQNLLNSVKNISFGSLQKKANSIANKVKFGLKSVF